MKKLLCLIVSVIIFISVFTIPAFANTIKFSGNNVNCKPGDTVTVSFSATPNSSGIGAADFTVNYDDSVFTFVDYDKDFPFSNNSLSLGNNKSAGTFKFALASSEGVKQGGTMFTITFKVANNAVIGKTYLFNLSVNNLTDSSIPAKKLSGNNTSATVTINETSHTSSIVQRPTSNPSTNVSSSTSSQSTSSQSSSDTTSSSRDDVSSIMQSETVGNVQQNDLVTDTDTDVTYTDINQFPFNFLSNSRLLNIVIVVLSVIALLLIVLMIIFIIIYSNPNKKEK